MDLLPVLFSPGGLVFSAVLLTLLMVSLSAVPFVRNMPSELLNPFGGWDPFIMVLMLLCRMVDPVLPAAFHVE